MKNTPAPKPEIDVRVGVITNFMAGGNDSSRELRQPFDILSAYEEHCRDLMTLQYVEYAFRTFTRAIIECRTTLG